MVHKQKMGFKISLHTRNPQFIGAYYVIDRKLVLGSLIYCSNYNAYRESETNNKT